MPKNSRRLRRLGLAAAIAAIATLAGPHAANAGTYTVSGTCGLWSPWNWDGSRIAVYAGCPALYARQTYGAFTTPAGVAGGWRFDAPWGTEIQSVTLEGALKGFNGWQAAAYTEGNSARTLVDCPGVTCPGGGGSFTTYPTYGAGAVVLRVRCGASSCSNNADSNMLYITSARFTLGDWASPAASVVGGSLISGGWKSGTASVVVAGSDNTGIQETRALIDGVRRQGCAE